MNTRDMFVFIIFLIAIDAVVNMVVHLIQGNPWPVFITSMIIRPVAITIVYFLCLLLVSSFSISNRITIVILAASVAYLMIPVVIFFLKSNQKSFFETFIDLHTIGKIFVAIYLPFIMSVTVNIILFRRYFNW